MLIGPNGSGKSGFLDVVGFLSDLLRVGPLRAVLGEGETVPQRAADPLHLCWMRKGAWFELAVELDVPDDRLAKVGTEKLKRARYEVRVNVGSETSELGLGFETLWLIPNDGRDEPGTTRSRFPYVSKLQRRITCRPGKRAPSGWKKIVSKNTERGTDYFNSETTNWTHPFRLGPGKSALANLPEDETRFPVATWVKRFLMSEVQKVQLNADAMRRPSPPGSPRKFLPDGSNLPWAVHALRKRDVNRFSRWIEHLQTAIPDLKSVSTVDRPEDRHRYVVVEYQNGLKAPSWVVSEGTLRLLALTLIAYLPDAEGIYLIEEPENGIHPQAVEPVYEALSSVYGAQVLSASHSPVVLGLAQPQQLLCFAKDKAGATDIVRGDRHPRLRKWQGELDLGVLFADGVLA